MAIARHPVILMSLGCLALLPLSFVLIQIPLVNILAALLLCPWWFGAAVQASMAATAWLALKGRIGRLWVLLPVVFWSGGVGLSVASAERGRAHAAAVEAANAAVTWRAPRPFEYRAVDRGSVGYSELVERYRYTRAYFIGEKDGTVRFYAAGAECEDASKGFYYDRRFDEPFLYRRDIFPSYKGADKTRQCVLSRDMREPPSPAYAVTNELSPNKGDWLNPRYSERFTVTDERSGETLAQVETASIKIVSPLLLLEVTCRIGGFDTPARDCGIWPTYRRKSLPAGYTPRTDKGNPFTPTTDPMNSRVGALGKAIGLEPRLPTD